MSKKKDNSFTWSWGNTFQENLDKILILFFYMISSVKKDFSKFDKAGDLEKYKAKIRNLKEKGYLNQCSFGSEDFYRDLLPQVLDNQQKEFTFAEKYKIFADFEKIAKIHVEDQKRGVLKYVLIGLISLISVILFYLVSKSTDLLYVAIVTAVAVSIVSYFAISSFFVYDRKIRNPKIRYRRRDLDVNYCFGELNRLLDNMDLYFEQKNNNLIVTDQKLQTVLINVQNIINYTKTIKGVNEKELNEGVNNIQTSINELKETIKQLATSEPTNEKPEILREMFDDGLIKFENDKYCLFGSLPEFFEKIKYHEKEKYENLPRNFFLENICTQEGTEFDDEYYSKQYGELFPKKKKKTKKGLKID